MRLSRCASTTPPPPKLTVRVALPGNVSTAHVRVVSGSAPRRARARSRTCAVPSIARAPQVTELEEPIDHPRRAVGNFLAFGVDHELGGQRLFVGVRHAGEDRKSTRLNSSHLVISYAVFCLKKKKIRTLDLTTTY